MTRTQKRNRRGRDWITLLGLLLTVVFFAVALDAPAAFAQAGRAGAVEPLDPRNPLKELWSGYRFMPLSLRRLEDDDARNPATLWLDQGDALWNTLEGKDAKSCANCHNNAAISMRGAATRFPRHHIPSGKLIALEDRINLCRTSYQKADALPHESDDLLALSMYVRRQSRGMVIRPRITARERPDFELGQRYFSTRRGQLNQSCASCHDRGVGRQLRATTLSQGQTNAFPSYRAAWARPGSVHRRVQDCNRLIRAAPLEAGDPLYVALELYLAWRGAGLRVEGPAVRP